MILTNGPSVSPAEDDPIEGNSVYWWREAERIKVYWWRQVNALKIANANLRQQLADLGGPVVASPIPEEDETPEKEEVAESVAEWQNVGTAGASFDLGQSISAAQPTIGDREFLSPEQLALLLGVPIKTLYRWRTKGTGPRAAKIGRHLRFRRSDVDAWLETRSDPLPDESEQL